LRFRAGVYGRSGVCRRLQRARRASSERGKMCDKYVIGYWMPEKKRQKFNWTDFENVCKSVGFQLKMVTYMYCLLRAANRSAKRSNLRGRLCSANVDRVDRNDENTPV
jgi:hypothetical protein